MVLVGTRRTGDPNVELPNVRSARSRSSWSTPGRKARTSSRTFDRLACGSHGARQMVTRASSPRAFGWLVLEHTVVWEIFIRSSNKSIVGGLPEKRDNTMPSWSWPNDIGVRWTSNRFCRQPSWGISSFVRAGLWVWPYRQVFALMEQTSRKPVLGTVLEWFQRLAPKQVREPT